LVFTLRRVSGVGGGAVAGEEQVGDVVVEVLEAA
jgi:hypothetical protein